MLVRNWFSQIFVCSFVLILTCVLAPQAKAQWSQSQVTLEHIVHSGDYSTTAQSSGWSVTAYKNTSQGASSVSGEVTTTFYQSGTSAYTVEKKANNTAYAQSGNAHSWAEGDTTHKAEWFVPVPTPAPTPTFDYTYDITVTTTVVVYVAAGVMGTLIGATSTGWIY